MWAIRSILLWCSVWQIKEYRLDRLWIHIQETIQGRALLLTPIYIANIVLLFAYGYIIFNDTWRNMYIFLVFCFYTVAGFLFVYEIFFTRFKRPAITIKTIGICCLTLLVIIIGFVFPLFDRYEWMLFLTVALPFILAVWVFAFSFPTELYKDYMMQKAREVVKLNKKLLIIGVSGSYGKSSTKEYISHVLSQKFSVVKTPLSNNTAIGISKTIIKHVTPHTEILIVEIGAYKKGEIAELCSIAKPSISVTTAIGDQHISLYGSLKNILSSEKELLDVLPKNGLALFNANSQHIDALYKKFTKKKILYGTDGIKHARKIDVVASNIISKTNGVDFSVRINNAVLKVHTPLLGEHNIENILPAIYLGIYLHISTKKIIQAISTLNPLPKTMKKFTSQDNVVLIDDTFNASPESVGAAIVYAKTHVHKKIFVLTPLIELGKKGKEHHVDIGKKLAQFDYLFLTNKNFVKEIQEGITTEEGKCKVYTGTADTIAERITRITRKGDIVVFEGKEAGNVLGKLL